MPDTAESSQFIKPFVYETLDSKALHFTISEIQSRMRLDHPQALDLAYTRTMMAFMLFVPQPELLAMIGLGGGSLAKFCHSHLPRTRTEVVEINPHVIALRDQFQVPPDDERMKIRLGDGADLVRRDHDRPDVLLVDGFDHEGQPPALCSQAFYDNCRDFLKPDGMLVVNLHTAHTEFALHVSRIDRAFGGDALFVSDSECSNTIAFAGRSLDARVPRPAVAHRPGQLSRKVWGELLPAFAHVAQALQQRHQIE